MKNISNKGFSLVELIIVIAIMAILVGVVAPRYVKYLDKTQKTKDCMAIDTILNACETIALDPGIAWGDGTVNAIIITIPSNGNVTYSGGASVALESLVPVSDVKMAKDDWGDITISAIKAHNGRVSFDIADDSQITAIEKYSKAVSERLQ